jgi:shikimate dehydrogenase
VGLVRDIEDHCGVDLRGARVLLVGAGGAAAGVLGPLLERGPHELVIVNRTRPKAEPLLARHAALARAHGATLRLETLDRPGERYDVVINATAASLGGQALALPQSVCKPGGLAVDLMYGPAAQPFMAWASAAGAHAVDGLGMLVEQAAESFFLQGDVRPHTATVLAELREYLKHR